jgi:large subunit ribosomal protein L32
MAVPKRRHSKSRTKKKRNAHYIAKIVNSIKCKTCGALKLPHRICAECGK